MKNSDAWWRGVIVAVNIGVLVLQFFISRTLSQYDATNQDHELRIREVERAAQNNAAMNEKTFELNDKTFEIVKVYMTGVKEDLNDLKEDFREVKANMK